MKLEFLKDIVEFEFSCLIAIEISICVIGIAVLLDMSVYGKQLEIPVQNTLNILAIIGITIWCFTITHYIMYFRKKAQHSFHNESSNLDDVKGKK